MIWLSQNNHSENAGQLVLKTIEATGKVYNGIWIGTVDSQLVDFRSTLSVFDYFEEIQNLIGSRDKVLSIIDYTTEKDIDKHMYISRAAKYISDIEVAYFGCPDPKAIYKEYFRSFDYILSKNNTINNLAKILMTGRKGIYIN